MAKIAKATESKDVAVIPVFEITPVNQLPVDGNFNEILSYLQKREKDVSKMKLTEDNIEQVKLLKKEATAYRTSIEAKVKETVKLLFDGPKVVFKSKVEELFGAIQNIESVADGVLSKLEGERIADLNKVLEAYKGAFQAKYKLDEETCLPRVEFKKEYYNKTQDEKKSKDDLEAQFIALRKEQDAHAANIRLIRTSCKDEPRLNVDHWIRQLAVADVATITEQIIAEKQRLAELDKPAAPNADETPEEQPEEPATEVVTDTEAIVLGVTSGIDFSSDFPDRDKAMQIEIQYHCDFGDALTEVFKRLAKYGVKTKLLKAAEDIF